MKTVPRIFWATETGIRSPLALSRPAVLDAVAVAVAFAVRTTLAAAAVEEAAKSAVLFAAVGPRPFGTATLFAV